MSEKQGKKTCKKPKTPVLLVIMLFAGLSIGQEDLGVEGDSVPNPSAQYCVQMGYEYFKVMTEKGEKGMCRFPDGNSVGAWEFLMGYRNRERSYCAQKGMEYRQIHDLQVCKNYYNNTCLACITDSGPVEVSKKVKEDNPDAKTPVNSSNESTQYVDYLNQYCGDDICSSFESHASCPKDCEDEASIIEKYKLHATILLFIIVGLLLYGRKNL